MSQTTFPFVPQQHGDGEPGAEPEEVAASRRPVLLVVGAALVAVVLGIAAWLLFFSGDGDEAAAPRVTKRPTGVIPSGLASPPSKAKPVPVPSSFTAAPGRNPFKPLANPSRQGGDTAPSLAPVQPGAQPVAPVAPVQPGAQPPAQPNSPPVAQPPAAPPAAPPVGPPAPPAPSMRLSVVSVADKNTSATFLVNGQKYIVQPKKIFATNFYLAALSDGKIATIQYGDVILDLEEGKSATFS